MTVVVSPAGEVPLLVDVVGSNRNVRRWCCHLVLVSAIYQQIVLLVIVLTARDCLRCRALRVRAYCKSFRSCHAIRTNKSYTNRRQRGEKELQGVKIRNCHANDWSRFELCSFFPSFMYSRIISKKEKHIKATHAQLGKSGSTFTLRQGDKRAGKKHFIYSLEN